MTVEPGVVVQFERLGRLDVAGKLIAIGTSTEPIIFTGVIQSPGSWQGLTIEGSLASPSAGSILSYVTVEYGGTGSSRSANLYLDQYAEITIEHSTFRHGAKHGIHVWTDRVEAHISDSGFFDNGQASAGYAVLFTSGRVHHELARLTASGNGIDAVGLGGHAYLEGQHLWAEMGLPYVVGGVTVNNDATLTIEPGVEVQFGRGDDLEVRGRLNALGLPTQPITFTGTTQSPGWWSGIYLHGGAAWPGMALFDYATVEYGGDYEANLYVSGGMMAFHHGTIRFSERHGVYASGNTPITIEASQIVSNTGYGVFTPSLNIVNAANNWWGSASGPQVDGACNPGGAGSRIGSSTAFRPFLTSPHADPGGVAPDAARIVSLAPQRWFAPANGLTRAYAKITVRDGNGLPMPGRRVRLQSSLGRVVDGGLTDMHGQTLAYITSTTTGEARLVAYLDLQDVCESARSPMAAVTFVPSGNEGGYLTADSAPYLSEDIQVSPMPIQRGKLTRLSARLTNPNDYPILVDASFSYVQASIGLAFGPVGEVNNRVIPSHSEATIEVFWTPSVSGRYCIELEYTARPATALLAATEPLVRNRTSRNINVHPGPFLESGDKDALKQANNATDAIDDAEFALSSILDAAMIPVSLIQDQLFGNILDFIYDGGNAISCALQGGTNCGGWKGPRLQLPGDSIGNLLEDPPSQNYDSFINVEPIPFTPLVPGPNLPTARTEALNRLMAASLNGTNYLFAAAVSFDRYAGAGEANDLRWASLQANAYLYYLDLAAHALIESGDAFDALIQEIQAEEITSVYVTANDYLAYQQRLASQGFTLEEIEAAHLVGFNDEAIEAIRQRRLATNPNSVAGDVLQGWAELATALRNTGASILAPPAFGYEVSGGGGEKASDEEPNHSLVRLFETKSTFQVGNPLTQTATVDLRLRPLDLPSDWMVTISPDSVTLAPGEQITATVSVIPGTAVVQGAVPRVAAEGYVGNELIGGVVVDIVAPSYRFFDGGWRAYLPLVRQ
ncbi:MAG: hypothetical protein WBR35_01460 [Anaerolineae bacterium]